ncbi:hypothetical protein GCM10009799_15640 [Nocardiopsis rhodophaea]|uniref:Uncharacterized protein n=1 Tax=Nocardiopsis rhodophaea TaxID=280238 RepID=A0ABP5E614_9ACTN
MTAEPPPQGTPGMAGRGPCFDGRSSVDSGWLRELSSLTVELRSCGLEARMDGVIGAVDAIAYGPARRIQRAVLRPHRGRLWWWLRWAGDPSTSAPHHAPLAPAAESATAARRIVQVLHTARR